MRREGCRLAGSWVLAAGLLGCNGGGDGRTSTSAPGLTSLGGQETGDQTSGTSATGGSGSAECTSELECPGGHQCIDGVCVDPLACEGQQDCGEGFACEEGVCVPSDECGGFVFMIEQVPPNLLILLDRSGSMDGSVPDTNKNRWEVAKDAILSVTTSFNQFIRFGLATYSSCTPGGCSAGTIEVPIADMNAAAINGFLATTIGQGSNDGQAVNGQGLIQYLCDSGDPETSTGTSLNALQVELSLQDTMRQNAVLLITDGSESGECIVNGTDGPVAAANLLAKNPPISTYAIGFGGANLAEVDAIAAAGGTGQGYLATNPADLQLALEAIAQSVASCTFSLDQVPPDPNQIYVFFDDDPAGIPNDPQNGWTYDPVTNTITFHGQACEALKSGAVAEIDITYGCNQPPVG